MDLKVEFGKIRHHCKTKELEVSAKIGHTIIIIKYKNKKSLKVEIMAQGNINLTQTINKLFIHLIILIKLLLYIFFNLYYFRVDNLITKFSK